MRNIISVATKLEVLNKDLKDGKIDKTEFDTQKIIMGIEQLGHEIRMLREELSVDFQSLKK
jgi:hypothetical protein